MSTVSIVMMILFMLVIWGGLAFAIFRSTRQGPTPAARYLDRHPELDD